MTGFPLLVSKVSDAARASIQTSWGLMAAALGARPQPAPTLLTFARETDLRDPVAEWMLATWAGAHVADEVGPRWAPADLVAEVPPVGVVPGELVSVELKLRDSRKALAQATLHRLFADLSYIAMPAARVSEDLLDGATSHGVGVLGVYPDGQVDCLLEAAPANPGVDLAAAAADTVRASALGVRGPVRVGGSRGGSPLLTAP